MENQRDRDQEQLANTDEQETRDQRDSGMPGGGAGRRETVGHTGVYPVSASEGAPADTPIHPEASWGQGERGAAGYEDSGGSELEPL